MKLKLKKDRFPYGIKLKLKRISNIPLTAQQAIYNDWINKESPEILFVNGNFMLTKESYYWVLANFRVKYDSENDYAKMGRINTGIIGDPNKDERFSFLNYSKDDEKVRFLPYKIQISPVYEFAYGYNCRISLYLNWDATRKIEQRSEELELGIHEFVFVNLSSFQKIQMKWINRMYMMHTNPAQFWTLIVLTITMIIQLIVSLYVKTPIEISWPSYTPRSF